MSIDLSTDRRISLCTFTFADGRRCRTPRAAMHQHLCTYHARKDAQARAAEKVGREIAYDLSGDFITANDLCSAIGHLFSAVAQGHIKPKTANTLAYLGQTMVQAVQLSRDEYIETYGTSRVARRSRPPPLPRADKTRSQHRPRRRHRRLRSRARLSSRLP